MEGDWAHPVRHLGPLSHQLGILDAFIAETAVGLGVTLATFNARYYRVVSALHTLQPYERQ
jgi:predicted nucleic acid-binding protein